MLHKDRKVDVLGDPHYLLEPLPGGLLAQAASPEPTREKKRESSQTQTVTGCLQKGDEAGEFSITGEDGKTGDCAVPRQVGSAPRPQSDRSPVRENMSPRPKRVRNERRTDWRRQRAKRVR